MNEKGSNEMNTVTLWAIWVLKLAIFYSGGCSKSQKH
jgi:hypothetical protein